MHRQTAYAAASGLLIALAVGCGLPKIALGASVSLMHAGTHETARAGVRSALWLALVYTEAAGEPLAPPLEADHDAQLSDAGAGSDLPCAFELTCELERTALSHEAEPAP